MTNALTDGVQILTSCVFLSISSVLFNYCRSCLCSSYLLHLRYHNSFLYKSRSSLDIEANIVINIFMSAPMIIFSLSIFLNIHWCGGSVVQASICGVQCVRFDSPLNFQLVLHSSNKLHTQGCTLYKLKVTFKSLIPIFKIDSKQEYWLEARFQYFL